MALEGAGFPMLFLEDRDSLLGQERLGADVFLRRHPERMMNIMGISDIRLDGIFRIGEHEAVLARLHEDHMVVAPDPPHTHDLGVELLRSVEILHRDREMENALGLQHPASLAADLW